MLRKSQRTAPHCNAASWSSCCATGCRKSLNLARPPPATEIPPCAACHAHADRQAQPSVSRAPGRIVDRLDRFIRHGRLLVEVLAPLPAIHKYMRLMFAAFDINDRLIDTRYAYAPVDSKVSVLPRDLLRRSLIARFTHETQCEPHEARHGRGT